jgi:hypothetical protein
MCSLGTDLQLKNNKDDTELGEDLRDQGSDKCP